MCDSKKIFVSFWGFQYQNDYHVGVLWRGSKNGKANFYKIPKWNWGASKLFFGSKIISMTMHIFIFQIFLDYFDENIIILILVAKFLKNVFVTRVQMSTKG